MKSIRTDPRNHAAEGDERIRTAVTAPSDDVVYEFRAALDLGFCGDRSSDLPLDHEVPPAVCILPTGHDGMHSNGRCAWQLVARGGAR